MRAIDTKTKILATVGPASDSKEKLKALVEAGVDAFRLNFSHSDHNYYKRIFDLINEVCVEESLPIAILIDLQGPKIRIGDLSEPEIQINSGDKIEITTKEVLGTNKLISTSYSELIADAKVGDDILIDDGLIHLRVAAKKKQSLVCEIIDGGILKPKKGMNLPGMKLSTPSLTQKDIYDLDFALLHRVDFIALSFVRKAKDILHLKEYLKSKNKDIPVIAKIEKKEAVNNFNEILKVSDGIMVARGDLGVELKTQEVPVIQKNIIRKCNEVGKLVITATQMLESMINNPVPTRAEASDIANAVWDGTDTVMLSGETSVGKYPIAAVEIMNEILAATESQSGFRTKVEYETPDNLADNIFDASGKAIATMADQLKVKAIVIFTHYGRKAVVVSKYRPSALIVAVSDNFETLNRLNLRRGIRSFYISDLSDEEEIIRKATEIIKTNNIVSEGDIVLFTSGAPISEKGRKSWVRFSVI
ncbi:pyruvate kinase [Melioribacteraceae bacterium 4301-Me]|uniref:pyruvate kinase n=1 Tax=Pyranulibacter aquaticus TaxID=3163344 RepID=UPI003596C39C